jgi:glycosyltransferase involved in cell wall biosynthesis
MEKGRNMIGLVAKNARAQSLFRLLCDREARFVDLGVAKAGSIAKVMSLGSSIRAGIHRTRMDSHFFPFQSWGLQRSCERLLARHMDISTVLYWGATDRPTRKLPYFIISDGPFDPKDSTYPEEWVPKRWSKSYLARQRRVYREAEHVFTLSQWAADKIRDVHNVPSENVSVIGWGPLHACVVPTLAPANGDYFVSVGSGWSCKGMDVLAAAAEYVHRSHPSGSVVLVGDPRGFEVRPRPGLRLIPHTVSGEEAQELISNARALLVGSRFDASPHVIMEAFQAGTPVIASRVCGIPEVVTKDMGYLVDSGDAEGFACAMRSCLEEDVTLQRTRVYQRYHQALGGWERVAQRVASKISEATGSPISEYENWEVQCAQS